MAGTLAELEFSISIQDAAGESRSFTNIKSLKLFIEKEIPFWNEASDNSQKNNQVNSIRVAFQRASQQVNDFEKNFPQWDDIQCGKQIQSFSSNITQIIHGGVFSDTPFAAAFLDAVKIGSLQAQSFWNYVTNYNNGQIANMKYEAFEGIILGYEFMRQEESAITKRRDGEKRVIEKMRKELASRTDAVIVETDNIKHKLINETEEYKNEIQAWKENTQSEIVEQRDKFFSTAATRLKDLETLYTEKLKLEKPAEYWHNRALQFQNAGRWWGVALVASTISSGVIFAWLFSEWLKSGKIIEKFSAQHWQGIILLAAVISLTAFLIRTFAKLTFSAFHLQRDAEEREQLSYVYLALAKETEFTDDSRKIVLQALFSRTETGLLSGDHGPTMPGVTEVISKIK